ncbi:hypothetical protein HPB47_022164 [Ixodes persulcatus]|uniref:Uncharacterized protein n=1 Tax=Ixodes persulcatus TaxID=34615 RepID=A0AC60QAF0_IXOPE|nr:hypothetical protein HPB47_022164 [Ixodes persulcatus]
MPEVITSLRVPAPGLARASYSGCRNRGVPRGSQGGQGWCCLQEPDPAMKCWVVRPRDDPFYRYDDVDFITRFRLSKDATIRLLSGIEHVIAFDGLRNCPLSPINQLLAALRFYAAGTFQVVLGDLWGVHKSTVCRVVKRVTHAIAALARDFISFPRPRRNAGLFPKNSTACKDSQALLEQSTARTFPSSHLETVSDHQLSIRNIVVRWPVSVHDSTIFGNSALKALFESGQMNESILLGDGGYACSRYPFTPVAAPKTAAERAYNRAHIPRRSTVERQYSVWKRRFPALEFGLRIKLETALSSIVAMAVVHNLALQLGEAEPPVDLRLACRRRVFSDVVVEHVPEHHGRTSARSALIDQVFARRARVARRRE